MASLISDITKILNKEETPWKERLKFADNAFVSPTLPIRQKEIFLLKWIINSPNISDKSALQQCLRWLTSSQIIDLNRSDISAEDLREFTNSLANCLVARKDDVETQDLLHSVSAAFIENKIFQHHFKFNMKLYYSFISTYITNMQSENIVETILSSEQLLSRSLPLDYKLLIENILWPLVKTAVKYPNSETIFKAISGLICRCIFKPNMENFNATLNALFSDSKRINVDIFAILFCTNEEASHTDRQMYYKLLLESFYKSTKNFSIIYKFIIVLFKNVGMQFGNMYICKPVLSINCNSDEGIKIFLQIFEVIGRNKNDFDCKVGDISFNDFIKHFAEVRLKQLPRKETLQLANIIFKLNASLIHDLTDNLLLYLLLNNFQNMQIEYNNLFRLLIETYFKLNRIPGLIHKLLAVPVDGLSNIAVRIVQDDSFRLQNEINSANIIEAFTYDIKNTLSPEILESLSNCLVQLVSNQSINIFMTLLHKFDKAIQDLESTVEDPKKIFILEIITTILCQVLSSVRFADNTISDAIMTKFVNIMEKIKEGLQMFGSSLVQFKHEPHMMRAFLNASYTWAELYIISEYYSINKTIICKKDTDFCDSSPYNISYLHNYLTSEQWCLISERITNFGEAPCKQLLYKLCIQKLKAMYIFETEINKDVFNSVQQSTVSSMKLVWNLLLTDQFALNVLLPTLEYQDKRILANCLILDITKNQEKSLFFKWENFNDMELNKAILINILQEISKLLRSKRKREDTGHKCNSTKLLKELLIDEALDEDRVVEIFIECIGKEDSVPTSYNENQMITYLTLLKQTPLSSFSDNIQITFFFYLCALLQDVKTVTSDENIAKSLESLILSTLQITPLPIIAKMPITSLITFIEQNFIRYVEIFEQILNIFVRSEAGVIDLSNGITLLIKSAKSNKKYIDLCLSTTYILFKRTNSKKISSENKALLEEYNNDLTSKLIKLILDKKVQSVEVYAYVLNNSVNKNNSEQLDLLLPLLDTYFKYSIANISDFLQITGLLTLFATILKNKSLLQITDADYTLSIWNTCKNITITEKDEEIYSKLIISIFENISNEQFEKLLGDILLSLTEALDADDEHRINRELKRCTSILPSTFNGTKLAIWIKALEQYLFKLTQYFSGKISNNTLVQFILNILSSTKMNLTPVILDLSFITIQNLLQNVENIDDFLIAFPAAYSLLDSLLRYRKLFILERLPAYLQQYRHLLALLCKYSDITKPGNDAHMDVCTEYAHSLEKLTTYVVSTDKHMSRISQYLITEFLKHYETITIHASVKLHLNNCIFQLLSLCDNHAVAYLMRALSTASTEMFKLLYETYLKYYKFKGKV